MTSREVRPPVMGCNAAAIRELTDNEGVSCLDLTVLIYQNDTQENARAYLSDRVS